MKKSTFAASAVLTGLLAAGAALGVAAPASADTPSGGIPKQITCPDNAPTTFGEFAYAKANGTSEQEYYADNGTAMQVFKVDDYYDVFGTNGAAIGRVCYDKEPPRLNNVTPAETQLVGSGGGGSSIGHFVHGPGIQTLVTTRWVHWKVRVG